MNRSTPSEEVHHHIRHDLQGVRFNKVTGPTGDWIVLHQSDQPLQLTPHHIQWLCNRTVGVGACGVVVIETSPTLNANKTLEQPHLKAWRANGELADDFTEPARIATYTLAKAGKITSHQVFQTVAGPVTAVYTPQYVGVDIGQWTYNEPETALAVGSDVLVMAAGLIDPRPGLGVHIRKHSVTVAVETVSELENIDLTQQPSVEPPHPEPSTINFVVPKDPLLLDGMGQLKMRGYAEQDDRMKLSVASAAATVAFQTWSGLEQLKIWNIETPHGSIIVQLHTEHRVSTYTQLDGVFTGILE